MADTFEIKVGNRNPSPVSILRDDNGRPIDLTGKTVKFQMRLRGSSGSFKVDTAATIVNAGMGRVRYDWGVSDTDTAGTYDQSWEVTTVATTLKQNVPSGEPNTVLVRATP